MTENDVDLQIEKLLHSLENDGNQSIINLSSSINHTLRVRLRQYLHHLGGTHIARLEGTLQRPFGS